VRREVPDQRRKGSSSVVSAVRGETDGTRIARST